MSPVPSVGFHSARLAVIGLGLIGCSWAKGLRVRGCTGHISGYDLNPESMRLAQEQGIIDDFSADVTEVVRDADFIIISVPIMAIRSMLEAIRPALSDSAVITDVGSVKGSVVADMQAVFGETFDRFVPGHPIAGSEKAGVLAANEDLYVCHKVILTPLPVTSELASKRVELAWQAVGADVELMSVAHHDEVLAATSHLPHLLAYSLVDTLANTHENKEIFNYAAGGFRDFTRIAASSPVMWRDIFSANKGELLKTLDLFSEDLTKLRALIEQEDSTGLMGVLTRAKAAREVVPLAREPSMIER